MIDARQAIHAQHRKATGETLISAASIIAAIASLSCCVIPFTLFLAGIGGAWMANLTALAPYKPIFVTAALVLVGMGLFFVHRKPKAACVKGSYCGSPTSDRATKSMLWLALALVVLSLAFPYFVHLLYGA